MKLPSKALEIIDLDDDDSRLWPDMRSDLEARVVDNRDRIVAAVEGAFADEMSYTWFTRPFVEGLVDGFVEAFDRSWDAWRREYARLNQERRELNDLAGRRELDWSEQNRRRVVEGRMGAMREGKEGFYTYRYLGAQVSCPTMPFHTHRLPCPSTRSRTR